MFSPVIKLTYKTENDNGASKQHKEKLINGFIPMHNQTILEFHIDLQGYPQQIKYDMLEDIIIEPDNISYHMWNFRLLKLEDKDVGIFTGTLTVGDLDEQVTEIQLIGRMVGPHLPFGVPFEVVPEHTK
jgi:hypothetical protein